MIISEYKIKRENSIKYDKKVKLLCDDCGIEYEMYDAAFKISQIRHYGKHRCKLCSNLSKYRNRYIGVDNKRFKGGISPSGYKRVYVDGKNQFEHRVYAENKLGRKLHHGEEVHHINGIKLDNTFDNLYIFKTRRDHRKCHYNMEMIALSLLDKKIWFNHKNETYTINKCDKFRPEYRYGEFSVVDIKKQEKVYSNDSYICKFGTNRSLHIFLIEDIIGRKLYRDEVVHHIDGNKQNNNVDNLFLTTRSKHRKMHESLWMCLTYLYEKKIVLFKDGEYKINEKDK